MKSNLLKNFLLAAASFCLTFLVLELFFYYVLDLKPRSYKPERIFEFSLLTGHFHKPNARGYWYRYRGGGKFHVSINSYGFADAPRKLEKDRPRIALIGDSTTQFWEARLEDRGQFVIEELLSNTFEVLNFGVRGYGTDQTFILFENTGIKFSPDTVIYTFCVNDFTDNLSRESKPFFRVDSTADKLVVDGYPIERPLKNDDSERFSVRSLDEFLKQTSYIYRRLRPLIKHMSGYVGPLESYVLLAPFKRTYSDKDNAGVEITLRIISEMKEYVESQGMKFMMVEGVSRPSVDEKMQSEVVEVFGDNFDWDKVTNILEEYSTANNIEFLSLPQLAKSKGIPITEIMHDEDYWHLDKNGIRFYAKLLVDKLDALGWLNETEGPGNSL